MQTLPKEVLQAVLIVGQAHIVDVWTKTPTSEIYSSCWVCDRVVTNSIYINFPVCPECVKGGRLLLWLLSYRSKKP